VQKARFAQDDDGNAIGLENVCLPEGNQGWKPDRKRQNVAKMGFSENKTKK
jgi:hypothetical protein